MNPFVTAIMPTRGRKQWAEEAIGMFYQQDYVNKELVVVDDASDLSFPDGLRGCDSRTILASYPASLTIGEKRNVAIKIGSGAVIIHWDSDDIYSLDRISHQVALLLEKKTDLVGYNEMVFADPETGERWLYHGSPSYAIGVSLCYWRSTWAKAPFVALEDGEDNDFVQKHRRTVYCCPAGGRIVARVHGGNTSQKRHKIKSNPAQWEPLGVLV